MTVYQEMGYNNRDEYLNSLAEEYNLSLPTVHLIAELLGPQEDFDGLVVALQDLEIEEFRKGGQRQ